MKKTIKTLNKVKKESRKFIYWYRSGILFKRRWIDLYDVETVILIINHNLDKDTTEVLIRLSVSLEGKKIKSLPWKNFKDIISAAKRACK